MSVSLCHINRFPTTTTSELQALRPREPFLAPGTSLSMLPVFLVEEIYVLVWVNMALLVTVGFCHCLDFRPPALLPLPMKSLPPSPDYREQLAT